MTKTIGLGTFSSNELTKKLVNEVLDSGRLSYGPMSRALERDFSKMHGCDFGVLSNSGTSSLQVALQAMKELHGWRDGDKVLVPSVTFVATVNIVLHNRMEPILVDVEPSTYGIDCSVIKTKDLDAKCIIPVHLFGQPADMTYVNAIAEDHDMKVIEDSCETMFATHDDRMVGSMGDIACFSFYMAHLITAGVGGISTTNNPDYAAKMRSLVNHGRDGIYISIDDDNNSANLNEVISRRFKFDSIGHSYRITELEAAIALAQLEDWESMINARRDNATALSQFLADVIEVSTPFVSSKNTHSYMMYPIIVNSEDKWGLCEYLEKHGVETREMLPITNQPVYQDMIRHQGPFPIARLINEKGFYVGCHQDLDTSDMYRVSRLIRGYFDG
jgi:dTDP-4-amino-4,6-dideoxygalactose transaminase